VILSLTPFCERKKECRTATWLEHTLARAEWCGVNLLENPVFGTHRRWLQEIASRNQRLRRGGTSLQAEQML
jgi:hypothetical protein